MKQEKKKLKYFDIEYGEYPDNERVKAYSEKAAIRKVRNKNPYFDYYEAREITKEEFEL